MKQNAKQKGEEESLPEPKAVPRGEDDAAALDQSEAPLHEEQYTRTQVEQLVMKAVRQTSEAYDTKMEQTCADMEIKWNERLERSVREAVLVVESKYTSIERKKY